MSLLRRRLMMNMEEMVKDMELIFSAEFTLEATITTSTYTTIATIDTGLLEGDLDEGEVLIAEIRMLEDLDTDDTLIRQIDRFEFLHHGTSGYCNVGYSGGNPTLGIKNDTEAITSYMSAAGGVFIYNAGRYMSTLVIAGRNNGVPYPVAGRYEVLLYKTGINIRKDYRQ